MASRSRRRSGTRMGRGGFFGGFGDDAIWLSKGESGAGGKEEEKEEET